MRDKISKRTVDALPRGSSLADTEVKGFTARRLPSGVLSYGFRYRDKTSGRARWLALGLHGNSDHGVPSPEGPGNTRNSG